MVIVNPGIKVEDNYKPYTDGMEKKVFIMVCVCMYVCMYVCTYVRTYVCMYDYPELLFILYLNFMPK